MFAQRWAKRILRAQPQNVVEPSMDVIVQVTVGEKMTDTVQDNEKLMNYLQKGNASGHSTNCDMLIASVNPIQHMREAILNGQVLIEDTHYSIKFPFGIKAIELKLAKTAVDNV